MDLYVHQHEERRRKVVRAAYSAYFEPVIGTNSAAIGCGTICRKTSSEAKYELQNYLYALRNRANVMFITYRSMMQQKITDEDTDRFFINEEGMMDVNNLPVVDISKTPPEPLYFLDLCPMK